MASLADLFDTSYVVYQSVSPSKKPTKETELDADREDTITRLYRELGVARQRISNLEESAGSSPVEPEEPEEPKETVGIEEPEKPEEPAAEAPASGTYASTASSPAVSTEFINKLTNILKGAGIKFRITSGLSPRDNPNSYHSKGLAIDIVPDMDNPTGEGFEELLNSLLGSKSVRDFFANNNIGLYDERTNRSGSNEWTGPHFHIGPDRVALNDWKLFLQNYSPQTEEQEDQTQNALALESNDDLGDLTADQKEKTRTVYNEMFKWLSEGSDAESADILARWYTAQWATDYDFSTRFKGFKARGWIPPHDHYTKGIYENGEPVYKWNLTYQFPEKDRVRLYVGELVHQNEDLENVESLDEFIGSISPNDDYKEKFITNLRRINKYLGVVKASRQGGKFEKIRNFYGKGFSKYR